METTNSTRTIDTMDTAIILRSGRSARASWGTRLRRRLRIWLTAWEIYPVLLLAVFLRFYHLSLTEFDTDQAVLWNTARVTLTHGLIPTASNLSSIGTPHFPLTIYILMVVGIFTDNPLAGAFVTALFNVLAVLFTYLFTRRYFGRLAGFVAAALTATAVTTILYSRFIWQPNLVALLIVLYMLALFRGAVERRSGWFLPALLLLALSFQLSESSAYLAPALLLALLWGYRTVGWRDLVGGVAICALIFAPYMVLEASRGFADLPLFLGSNGHTSLDSLALKDYLHFVVAYSTPPTDPQMLLTRLFPLLHLHRWTMLALLLASLGLLLLGLFWERVQLMARGAFAQSVDLLTGAGTGFWRQLWRNWRTFFAVPQRRALLLLATWQLLPLALLLRHTISLQVHYLLILVPGPFILIGLLVSQLTSWSAALPAWGKMLRPVVPVLATVLILAQTVVGVAWVLDTTSNNQPNTTNFNTLQDLRTAVQTADQLALAHHFKHVYIDTDARTVDALNYLARQMQTAHTLLNSNSSHCLLLPGSAQGPAVMLLGPGEPLDQVLLTRFASATLVSKPPRLGGAPFSIYIVQPFAGTTGTGAATGTFTLDHTQPALLSWQNPATPAQPAQRLFTTLWNNQAQRSANTGSWWSYHFAATYTGQGNNGNGNTADCRLTSLASGEQLLVPFTLSATSNALPTSVAIIGTIASNTPYVLSYGPLHFQTLREQTNALGTFQGTTGKQ